MALSKENASFEFQKIASYYVDHILASGLLLDEDLESILFHYQFRIKKHKEIDLSLKQKILSGISVVTTMVCAKYKYSYAMLTIAASPLLVVGAQCLKTIFYTIQQKRNIDQFLKTIFETNKLNRSICAFLKLRNNASVLTVDIINPYTPAIKNLLDVVFKEETDLLHQLRTFIRNLGTIVPWLTLDYSYIDIVEFDQFVTSNISCMEDSLTYTQKLSDVFMLISSHFLTSVCLVLCPAIWDKYSIDTEEILSKTVPKVTKMAANCYKKLSAEFHDVTYYPLNKNELDKARKRPKPTPGSRLYTQTCNMLMQMSYVLEKSQTIYKELQKHNIETFEKEKVSACITELRSQVYDCYESLDLLHKLYEIQMNRAKPRVVRRRQSDSSSVEVIPYAQVDEVNFNPVESIEDEVFEAYVGDDDCYSDYTSYSYQDEDESRKYAKMLSDELKSKLKSYVHVLTARKRGEPLGHRQNEEVQQEEEEDSRAPMIFQIEVDEEEENAQAAEDERNLFQFFIPNAPSPIRTPDPRPNCEPLNRPMGTPPPPPPPLPPLEMPPHMAGSPYTIDDFLESVRSSAQLIISREEEVYGDLDEDRDYY